MWGCHIKQVKLADDLLPQHWTGGVVQRSNKDDMMVVVEIQAYLRRATGTG